MQASLPCELPLFHGERTRSKQSWDKAITPEERSARAGWGQRSQDERSSFGQPGGQAREEAFKAAVATDRPAKDAEVLLCLEATKAHDNSNVASAHLHHKAQRGGASSIPT